MDIDLDQVPHHITLEEIAHVLSNKVQNTDLAFLRMNVAFFIAKMASCQRATLVTKDRGPVPVNLYAFSLATSGSGKGHSIGLLETRLVRGFKDRFINEAMPLIADNNLFRMAKKRALRNGTQENDELSSLKTEYAKSGAFAFTFDSATAPAVKQLRHRLLLAGCGSINMQIDEIGNNLLPNAEALNVFLELYDQGETKQKLTKNTVDNSRNEEVDGKTPTNMLLFGTPTALLDGAKTEEEFFKFLETGYARRCFFAYGEKKQDDIERSAEEVYALLTDTTNEAIIQKWADHCVLLADPSKYNWLINVDDTVGIEIQRYKLECERRAAMLPAHEEVRKAELSHRYYKALKLAGAFAFFEEVNDLSLLHFHQAVKIAEESGIAFERLFKRDKNYVRLAKYLAEVGVDQTQADLVESLPFFKGTLTARNEMLNLATAWGYRNKVIIKKLFVEGIDFFRGEKLDETDIDKMLISYSDHVAYNYRSELVPFSRLHEMTQSKGYHWLNHALVNGATNEGHRTEENCIPGFNMVVIDVDKGTTLDMARELLKEYTYLIYTTKRHQTQDEHGNALGDRFRVILPINYTLELDKEEFAEFMQNVYAWLPFDADTQTNQRGRKWETFPGHHWYNEGHLLDALKFIPKTSKNEEFKKDIVRLENLDNLERWFAQRMVSGSRNNNMLKFALALVDSGLDYTGVEQRVLAFNNKLDNRLPDDELHKTVLVTVSRKLLPAPHGS